MEGAPWVISTRFTWDILGSIVTRPSTVNEARYLSGVGRSIKESHYTYFINGGLEVSSSFCGSF